MEDGKRIVKLTLDEKIGRRSNPDVEHERNIAVFDLLEENAFAPACAHPGPYALHLRIEEDRLLFQVCDPEDGRLIETYTLGLAPFRKLVKDYYTVCESYFQAIKTASPSRIEAIDMGRRALHDESAIKLREGLADKIDVDHPTARRLFTLLCVLHFKG